MSHYGAPPPVAGAPALPRHPKAQKALVLGIVALGGTFFLVLPVFLSPYAWYYGAKVKREMAATPGRWSGGGDAGAGMILGIVGSVLLVVLLIALMLGAAGLAFLTHHREYY